MRPRLLDLFCGAGGAAMGYHRAGFDVVGVDIAEQPSYPFEFLQADALEVDYEHLTKKFDAVHASPPCQKYSSLSNMRYAHTDEYSDLYEPTRDRLQAAGVPWVLENVIGAPYRSGFMLCGSMFGLKVRRHRMFETSWLILGDRHCDHRGQGRPYGVYGHGGGGQMTRGYKGKPSEFAWLMDMPWAKPREIAQAIPPAYTEWIGARLLEAMAALTPKFDPNRQTHLMAWHEDPEFIDWLNQLMENAGDEWDIDEAMTEIAIRYVRHLEAELNDADSE